LRLTLLHKLVEDLVPKGATFNSVKDAMQFSPDEPVYGQVKEVTLAYLRCADLLGRKIGYPIKEALRWTDN
jgi:hypothetical protein